MLPGLTRLTLNSYWPGGASAAPTRWKDIRPPLPHDRGSPSVASTAAAKAAPVDADAVLDLDDEAPQRPGAVDRGGPVDDGDGARALLDVGLGADDLGRRGSARRPPRPVRAARLRRRDGDLPTAPQGPRWCAARTGGGRGGGRRGEREVDERDQGGDGQQRHRVGAPAVPPDEARDPAGPRPGRPAAPGRASARSVRATSGPGRDAVRTAVGRDARSRRQGVLPLAALRSPRP